MMTDMTKGNATKLILAFTVPILIGNLFQQLYSMVDTAIVGQFVGVQALAAVGSTGGLIFLVQGFVNGLTHGFSVIVSQRYGANDEEGIKKVEFIINETEKNVLNLDQVFSIEERKEFEYAYPLHDGENKLEIRVYNESDVCEISKVLVNK